MIFFLIFSSLDSTIETHLQKENSTSKGAENRQGWWQKYINFYKKFKN